jgi:hypothetical protein
MFGRWKLRPRFRLRTLLVGITICCVLLTALPFEARQYQQRKARMRSLIVGLGGSVESCGSADRPSPGANWLAELLGYVEPRESQWQVNLAGTSVSPEDLSKLRGSHWILRFDLSHTNVGDDALSHIAMLGNLLELRLRNTGVTDSGLLKLKPLSRLLILDVGGTAATYKSLAQLEQVMVRANLQEQLAISRVRAAGIVVDLGAAALNRKLVPGYSRSPEGVLASIQADLTAFGLQPDAAASIVITRPVAIRKSHIEDLRRLVSAKTFAASSIAFPRGGLSFLPDLNNLESVTIVDEEFGNLTDDDVGWLAQVRCLKTVILDSQSLTDAGIAHLAGAPQLTSLSLDGNGFTDDVFAPFSQAHQIESLSMRSENLTPELVANLRGLNGLRRLELSLWYRGRSHGDAVWPEPRTDQSMQWVFGRPPGEVVDAARESLHHLAAIPNLKRLSLLGNLMVAEVLAPIPRLSSLEWLKVDGRYVSHEEARQLQVAMPHCHVQRLDLE